MPEIQTESCPACGSLLDVTGAQIFAERTCPICGAPIHVCRTFGHYELLDVVGRGGQGVVYRALDTKLNRHVALKLLRTEYSSDPEFVRLFESEAQVTASINHPNVVRVFSFGANEGHVFLAMELVGRGTLDALMETTGRVPEVQALQIGIEIAQGLKAGFERGLIHRDVKPGNILFADDGTTKIVDFGLAMLFEQQAQATGEVWGTPYYLSPERLNRVPEDFRSDIYSLGATLFHAIAGRPPFEAEDASHVALKHLRAQAVSIQAWAPHVCNATAYAINRTLLKNPDERQQSHDEFIEQLQFARDEALAWMRAGGRTQQKARVVIDDAKAQKATSWFTVAILIVLVAGLIFGGMVIVNASKKVEEVANPVEVVDGTIESFGAGWGEAKQSLIEGNYGKAREQFQSLREKHASGTAQHVWAVVNFALASQLAGRGEEAAGALRQLPNSGTQAGKFFREEIAPKLAGKDRVPALLAREFSRNNHEALGALFFALKDYELGFADEARTLVNQFITIAPEAKVAWLWEYRKLAKSLQDEFAVYGPTMDAWTMARSGRDREQALVRLRELPGKLPPNSKLRPKVQQILADALVAKQKINFAYNAKATASASGDKPELAVDGNSTTRWSSANTDGDRWLALDLGAAKKISRWVMRTASAGGDKAELNLSDFKLQRSDDGKSWSDVDSVIENRAGITDRIVPVFEARHVRVLCLRNVKAGDNTARIVELELSDAAEQAKADYALTENVALRFSASGEFLTGQVGDTTVAGSARFDENAGKFTVAGSGADVWGNNDAFQFVWQPVQGDCEIVAKVQKLDAKNDWSKAGVMIRSDFAKDASHVSVLSANKGKIQFTARKAPGAQTTGPVENNKPFPRFLKLVRQGTTITGYESADGSTWTEVGKETLEGIGAVAFVGLAVCSHVPAQTVTAEFLDVKITRSQP